MLGDFFVNILFLVLGFILLWNGIAGFTCSFITMIACKISTHKALFIAEILNFMFFLILFIAVIIFEIYWFQGNIIKILLWLIPNYILGTGLLNAMPIYFFKILHKKIKLVQQN